MVISWGFRAYGTSNPINSKGRYLDDLRIYKYLGTGVPENNDLQQHKNKDPGQMFRKPIENLKESIT